jgi:hypothetical protein
LFSEKITTTISSPPGERITVRGNHLHLTTRRAEMPEEKKPQELGIKITDEILRGVYANNMVVAHTKEEFFVDFINVIPPQGIVTARVIMSPGHMKRIIRALSENLRKYEARFGEIAEAPEPMHVASA